MSGPLIFLSFLFLAACASVDSIGPTAFVDTPEVSNSKRGETSFQGRVQKAQHFHLVDDASSRPLKITNPPKLESENLVYGGVNIALGGDLDLTFVGYPLWSFGGLSYTLQPSLKWQFWGETGDKPESLGPKASLFTHLAYTKIGNSGNQDGFFGRGGYPWSATSEFKGISAGFSYGYRTSREMLYYGGFAYQVFDVFASVHQDVSQTGDYPAADAQFPKTSGLSSTASLGLNWGVYNQLNLAYSYTRSIWSSFSEQFHGITLGVQISGYKKEISALKPINTTP